MCALSGQGWYYGMGTSVPTVERGYGYRYGKWKLAVGGYSCTSDDCKATMLYDLSSDLGERHNLNETHPGVLAAIVANFSAWNASVQHSRAHESFCVDEHAR